MPIPVANPWDVSVYQAASLVEWLDGRLGKGKGEALVELGAVYVNRKRCQENIALVPRDMLRVHLVPRRFFTEKMDWPSRIVADRADFLVLDKPAGIPVHPTCDNIRDSLLSQLESHLKIKLWVLHRLDISTSGLMMISKSPAFCREFQIAASRNLVRKEYEALLEGPVPTGIHTHFMGNQTRAPFIASPVELPSTKPCSLQVLSCVRQGNYWRAKIHLITGKQHQIRAQMSALGSPILGDTLYGAQAGHRDSAIEKLPLACTYLRFGDHSWKVEGDGNHAGIAEGPAEIHRLQ